MKRHNQKGAALIFATIFALVLTIMGASLMFLSQSETWSSLNYRLMTESRYGAEAGLHTAANYLMNNYVPPTGNVVTNTYNAAISPVTLLGGGNPIVLGVSMNGLVPNYPDGAVQTGFTTASSSYVTAGNNTVNYTVNAELLSMRPVKHCLTNLDLTAQLWKLTSHGDINGVRNSEVEVSALLESHVVPCFNYAGYATGTGCGSISFTGGGQVDSYDSSTLAPGTIPVPQNYEGNLGSNGNVNTASNTVINGTFSSPDTGVGGCAAGAVDALSGNTTAVTGCGTSPTNCIPSPGIVRLPQAVTFPLPPIPNSTPNPAQPVNGTSTLDPCVQNCPHNGGGGGGPNANGSYDNITLSGNEVVTLNPGTDPVTGACKPGVYYINSITLTGNATLTIAPCTGTGIGGVPAVYKPVVINIVGQGLSGSTVLDLGGNGSVLPNNMFDASLIQFQYDGPGAVNLHGNGNTTGVIYAPNAPVTLSGNGTIFGSVIGNTLLAQGNPVRIHYDRNLQNNLVTVGNWTMDTFTWSKF